MARRATVVATVALGVGMGASPVMAQTTEPSGPTVSKLCRGTAVKTGNLIVLPQGLTLASANNRETPCANDYQKVVGLRVPVANTILNPLGTLLGVNTGTLLTLGVLEGLTADEPNDNGAGSTARVAYAKLNVLNTVIEVGAVESHARARAERNCETSQFGYSDIASLKVNGKVVFAGHQASTIPLGPLGAIYLNQTVRDGTTLTQRAVFIDLPGTSLDIALGESKAGAKCTAPPVIVVPNPDTVGGT